MRLRRLVAWWRRMWGPVTEPCPNCGGDMICDEFYQAHGLSSVGSFCPACWTHVHKVT